MSTLLVLTVGAVLALVVAPRLATAGWVLRAPRLALLAWQSVSVTVVLCLALAGATALLHWRGSHDLVGGALQICLDTFAGAHGRVAQFGATLGLLVLLAVTVRLALGAYVYAGVERRTRRNLTTVVRLAGRRLPQLDATVVPSSQPAAYLLPGHAPGIVVTSAAVERLSRAELRAVLAHERAHVTGRHHQLLRVVQVLARAFPGIPLFRLAQQHVRRLIEMCADETALRTSRPVTLARALVCMATPATPAEVLHVNGGDTVERLHRLLEPPRPLNRSIHAAGAAAFLALPALPVAVALADGYLHLTGLSVWLW